MLSRRPLARASSRATGGGFLSALAVLALACGESTLSSPDSRIPDRLHSTATDAGPDSPAPKKPDPGVNLFGEDQVLEVRLTISAADLQRLEERGYEEIYLPAQATISGSAIGEVALGQIGVRHKGAYTLHHCWEDYGGQRGYTGSCAKLSYKLKLHEYDPQTRLDGLKRLNLHAAGSDDTKLHELIAYETFREFGIEAPRTAVGRVYVNDQFEGLFIVVEEPDGRFTKAHFPEGGGDGNLYKELWPHPGVSSGAASRALRTNEDTGDVTPFLAFAQTLANGDKDSFTADMSQWVDIDQLLRYVAVDRAIKNWDGIMAFYSPRSPHNFYWYHDELGTGRFALVPWDMDNALWDYDPYMAPPAWITAPPVPNWNEEPAHCGARSVWRDDGGQTITPPRCDSFLDRLAETHWSRFEQISNDLVANVFNRPRLVSRVAHYASLLEPVIVEDPYVDVQSWRDERRDFEDSIANAVASFQDLVLEGLIPETPTPQ